MDLNAARMFVTVVQAGSLSAAASRLGIPLPTLSRRIRELERQLSVQLLERSARGTRLTDAGARLYEQARGGIEALLDAEQTAMSDQARLKGRLRLSLPQTFEPWWDLLTAFQRRPPCRAERHDEADGCHQAGQHSGSPGGVVGGRPVLAQ